MAKAPHTQQLGWQPQKVIQWVHRFRSEQGAPNGAWQRRPTVERKAAKQAAPVSTKGSHG